MKNLNATLWAKAEAANASEKLDEMDQAMLPGGQSTTELLDLWAAHNVFRGMFLLAASIIALWTTFG